MDDIGVWSLISFFVFFVFPFYIALVNSERDNLSTNIFRVVEVGVKENSNKYFLEEMYETKQIVIKNKVSWKLIGQYSSKEEAIRICNNMKKNIKLDWFTKNDKV